MQAERRHWNVRAPSPFRKPNMTFWSRSHPVVFPHVKTDHWSKMKTAVPSFSIAGPGGVVRGKGPGSLDTLVRFCYDSSGRLFPVLISDTSDLTHKELGSKGPVRSHSSHCSSTSPQDLPQYRNEYNDRARRGFCYWPLEKRVSKCYGYSFGAYKTALGLPRV